MNEPRIAPASESDVRELASRRFSDDASRRLYANLAAAGGAWVARDEGVPIAAAFVHAVDDERFVSECFVEPSFRRSGLASKLMDSVLRDDDDAPISALIDANDRAAIAFASTRGLALHAPVLRLAGRIPREEDLARLAAGDYRFAAVALDVRAHGSALDELDRDVRGSARSSDHAAFAELASATAFLRGDECVGYAYVWPDGRIGPLAYSSGAYALQFFGFALATLARTYGASWCSALVPGSNARILRSALRNGLAVERAVLFASDGQAPELSRYVGFHELAF